MSLFSYMNRCLAISCIFAAALVIAPPVALAGDGPNQGSISLSTSVDVTTAYFFRGIVQEDQGSIIQPAVEVGFSLSDNLSLSVGIWNSFHDGPSGTAGGATDPESWYESDLYISAGTSLSDDLDGSVTLTWYTSPNDAFATVTEVAIGLSIDDSDGLALSPSLTLAMETSNSAFGAEEGTYLELGIEPSLAPFANGNLQNVALSMPITLGLGINDYYETATDDDDFGFLDIGIVGSMPLSVPASYGSWTLSAGVHYLMLGDNTEAANGGDDDEIIATVGISMGY